MQKLALLPFGLAAFDRQHVLFGGDGDFIRRKASQRQRDLVAVLSEPLDVAGWVVVVAAAVLRRVNEIEEAVKSDGRPPQGCEVVSSPHSQILHRARWVRADAGAFRRPSPPGPRKAPGPRWAA